MAKSIQKKHIALSKWISFFGLFMDKSGTLLYLFIILLASVHSPASAQERDCDEVLVTLQVKYIGSTELPSIICGEQVYLSVPDVFAFLQIKNTTNATYSIIEGFFIQPNNAFKIDETAGQITYKGHVIPLKPGDLIGTTTNLFLKASYFNRVFELENNFSFRNLSVSMSSKLELPAVREARIAQLRANINKIKNEFTADTTIIRDKPLFHFGTADYSVNTTQQTNGVHSERLLLNLGGMLAGGELTSALNYGSNQPFLIKNQQYRWRYVNDDNKYISQITLGKIGASSTATILYPIVGGQITNAPTQIRKSFGTYTLSDHTQPDWMVELYINNVLVDYIKADANGFFTFNVPLMYGRTEISLRYYGPWGEEQITGKQFVIPFQFLPKKELEYNASSGIIEDGKNSLFANAKVNYGLSDHITIGGGMEYVSSLKNNKIISFLNSSIRVAPQLFISGGYYHKVMYNGKLNYTAANNLRLEVDYSKYDKTQQAVRFNYSEMRKATLSFPFHTAHFSGNSRLSVRQNLYNTSKYTTSELLLSGMGYGLNFNFTTNSFFADSNKPFLYSNLSTSLLLPKGFVLIPQVRYEYNADGITSLRAELKKQVFKKGFVQASFDHNFKTNSSYLQIGFRYDFETISTGFSSSFTKNQASFSQSASGSLIYEPKADFIDFNNKISVGRASMKFIPFLDTNGNGKRDPNEPLVIGIQIILNGGGRQINSKDGTTIITGLEPYIKNHVELNTDRINNIAWRVNDKNLNITLNPNHLKIVEIPVVVVGEVGGTVNRNENGLLIGTGGLKINIYDTDNVLTTTILSEPDGYFSFLGLKSGGYSAKIDSLQLQKLQMWTEPANSTFVIDNGTDGAIVDNIEFVLYKGKIEKPIAETIHEGYQSEKANFILSEKASDKSKRNEKASEQLVYSVQLLASKRKVALSDPFFKGLEDVEEYLHEGMHKYTAGASKSVKEANKIKNKLLSRGFHGAFVVSFYDNERISMQETEAINKKDSAAPSEDASQKLRHDISNPNAPVTVESAEEPSVTTTEKGLIFKTQLLASKRKVALSDPFFKGLEDVEEYLHEGMYKYTTGASKSVKEADKIKNKLLSRGFHGAFVVSFYDNERINFGKTSGVVLYKNKSLDGIAGIRVLIYDTDNTLITSTISEADGTFDILGLKQGDYTARLDSVQLDKAQMYITAIAKKFSITKDSWNAEDKLEFVIEAKNNKNKEPNERFMGNETTSHKGLVFKVQIMTSKYKQSFSNPLFINLKGIEMYKHKGLYKYTWGEANSLDDIRKIKKDLQNHGFKDAFIVPFYNDMRISMQEVIGEVSLEVNGEFYGVGGIKINIYDENNKFITSLLSKSDGSFSFLGLHSGNYTAELNHTQLDSLQMLSDSAFLKFSIDNNIDGNIDEQLKFILHPISANPK